MLSNKMMGWGAIIMGVLIAATAMMGWPVSLYYLWALIVLAWGVMTLVSKPAAPAPPARP